MCTTLLLLLSLAELLLTHSFLLLETPLSISFRLLLANLDLLVIALTLNLARPFFTQATLPLQLSLSFTLLVGNFVQFTLPVLLLSQAANLFHLPLKLGTSLNRIVFAFRHWLWSRSTLLLGGLSGTPLRFGELPLQRLIA